MIGFLRGTVLSIDQELLLLTGGVGYQVAVPEFLLKQLVPDQSIDLYLFTHVAENNLDLYGFAQVSQKKLFQLLITVNGVGPRLALGLLNQGDDQLIQAINQADVKFLSQFPRVGKKLAQKIILDLQPKLADESTLLVQPRSPKREAVTQALEALGFDWQEINQRLEKINLDQPEEIIIKQALQGRDV